MKKPTAILFIVNGYGLGNSTRCHALMESLGEKYQISVACSGNSLEYFRRQKGPVEIIPLSQIQYEKNRNGHISLLGTFLQATKIFKTIRKNAKVIQKRIREKSYSAIFIDSDYSFLLLSLTPKPPVYSINNSANVVKKFREILWQKPTLFPQYVLELFDYFFQRTFPNKVFVPSLQTESNSNHFFPISPISRNLGKVRSKKELKNILVFFSGAKLYSDLDFLLPIFALKEFQFTLLTDVPFRHPNVQVFGIQYAMEKFFDNADALIINAGFSSISEAVNQKIPALILPVENHAEQWVNALEFARLGYGIRTTQSEILSDFSKFCAQYANFVENLERQESMNRPFSFEEAISL
jgi:uncharacterized protein (TIGR00661 family)